MKTRPPYYPCGTPFCGHDQGDHLNTPRTDRCTVCTCPEWTRPTERNTRRAARILADLHARKGTP